MIPSALNIAPDVFRQRLLIESFYDIPIEEATIKEYLLGLAASLDLKTYADPIIFSPASGMGKDENAGFDAFVPLIDSGISLYIWTKHKFFSVLVYTCKGFDQEKAEKYSRDFFNVKPDAPLKTLEF